MTKAIINSIIVIFSSLVCFAQNPIDQFNTAKAHYENGNYPQAIQNLKALELSMSPNPKVQSLLIHAYVASNDFVNAAISLNKFKKLIGSKRTPAIQSVLDLEKQINAGVATAQSTHNETVQKKRMAEAKNIIDQQTKENVTKQQALTQQYTSVKNQITGNANPEEIAASMTQMDAQTKFEVLKSLRKDKKIKRMWRVQFSDKKLNDIVQLSYLEYNEKGELIKSVTKEYGDKFNIAFSAFPKFETNMLTKEYIEQLERTKDFNYFTSSKVLSTSQVKALQLSKLERKTIQKSGDSFNTTNDMVFRWKDNFGKVVKDSTISGQWLYVNSYGNQSEKWLVYLNNKLHQETSYELLKSNNVVTENSTFTTFENNKKNTTKGSRTLKYNNLEDLLESKDNNGFYENNSYKYDLYGNVSYLDKYNVSYDYYYSYYYYFYEYYDGYQTKIEDFTNQVQTNQSSVKQLSATEIKKNFNEGAIKSHKNPVDAKRLLEICLDAEPNNTEYLYWMAVVHDKGGALEKAIGFLDRLLAIDPNFGPAYELKGKIYGRNSTKRAQAIEQYTLAADCGMTSAVKLLASYNVKHKPDKKLFSKDTTVTAFEVKEGTYQYVSSSVVFVEIKKGEKTIYFRYTDKNESSEYVQSKKNPNLYLWKSNPDYRMVVAKDVIYYCHPDGIIFYKLRD